MQNSGIVYSQPVPMGPPGEIPVNGITVRPLRDTPEDAAFAGRVMVEAFKDKFAHSVTKEKLPTVIKVITPFYQNQYPQFYTRNFVAELGGRLVGFIGLKFKGDRIKEEVGPICDLGCWHACRFLWFSCIMDTEVTDRKKCLLEVIGVDDYARGRGVGKLLMDRAEYEARREGSSYIFLMVITTNRAIHLYERQGYTRKETHSSCCFKCVAGPPGSYHVMEKPLGLTGIS